MSRRADPARRRCSDCRVDTFTIDEYYMVNDEVWPIHKKGGMLCIGCLEERIGRRLTPEDFTRVPTNLRLISGERRASERLRSRLGLEEA